MDDEKIEGATLELKCEGCGRWIDSPVFTTDDQHHYCCEDCVLGTGCTCPTLAAPARAAHAVLAPEWVALARG